MKCPNCGFESYEGAKYCGMCGTHLVIVCEQCGFENPLTYRFCGMCGTALVSGGLPAPAQPVAEPVKSRQAPEYYPARPSQPAQPVRSDLSQLEGERRVATVIMADVRNSTDLMEQIGSEAWVATMNRVFQILEAEIYRFGGQVGQFRGDGLVSFFGTRAADEDDPEHAILAALSMQRAIKGYAAQLAEKGLDLQLRIGVNTGEVIVTSIGERTQYREEDTAMGEAIAVAARMETSAEPGTVLVSSNTYFLVKHRFRWQTLGEIMVKGVSHPIAVYRPLEPVMDSDQAQEPLASYWLAVPLTGRTEEFKIIKEQIEELQDGRGGILLVSGEKGMGKSFLINQVRQYFNRKDMRLTAKSASSRTDSNGSDEEKFSTLTWLRGRCRSYEQNWPYSMWIDLLKNWLTVRPDESREEISECLKDSCQDLWGEDYVNFYPYLAAMLGLPIQESFLSKLKYLSAEALQNQFFVAVRSWVEAMAERGPLVIAFGDIHWADSSSISLLKYCMPVCDISPLLWLVSCRPDRLTPAWELRHHIETEYPHRMTDLLIPPLKPDETIDMIHQLIGHKVISDDTEKLIAQRSEGNPFYVQELLLALVADGVIVQDNETGRWQQTREVNTLDLPSSLQTSLLARIDRLTPDEKRLIQVAAVIGVTFWRNVLQSLVGPNENIKPALVGLQRSQLIQEHNQVPNLGMEYTFTSAMVRDVAYESLLSSQRVALHLAVASYLEEFIDLEGSKQFDSLLAYHYRNAGEFRKELFYTLSAAEQSQRIFANAEALGHYNRSLELLDIIEHETTDPNQRYLLITQRFEVLVGRREMNYVLGNVEEARADSRALLPLVEALGNETVWRIDALLRQPELQDSESREELETKGIRMAYEALELARSINDRHRELFSLTAVGSALSSLKDPSWIQYGDLALALAREINDRRMEVMILLGISDAYGIDNLEKSHEYIEQALAISQEMDDKLTQMNLLSAITPKYERSGDYYRQLTEYEKHLKLCRQMGNRLNEGHSLMFCGQIKGIYLGDYQGGIELMTQSLLIWEKVTARLYPLLRLAQMHAITGNFAKAQQYLEEAQPLAAVEVLDLGRVGLALVTAIYYNATGEEEKLLKVPALIEQVRQIVAENQVSRQYIMPAGCELSAAYLSLAKAARTQEDREETLAQALEAIQSALDAYRSFGFVQAVECTSEEILYRANLVYREVGRTVEADDYLRHAYDEMMRKHALIPSERPDARTYLENIPLHLEIRQTFGERSRVME